MTKFIEVTDRTDAARMVRLINVADIHSVKPHSDGAIIAMKMSNYTYELKVVEDYDTIRDHLPL